MTKRLKTALPNCEAYLLVSAWPLFHLLVIFVWSDLGGDAAEGGNHDLYVVRQGGVSPGRGAAHSFYRAFHSWTGLTPSQVSADR
ncbi:hypothetical protein JS756_28845 [Streptomyces actuosus]|uniref:HTH araC/xylS-type domain-containing protein n=1 Tax=Streptomyces actuosus TaxID=1885 RepID=A0ABS2VYD1_STRAS|nr:hypothetical protein [Streptomyces actuosus]MBN0048049.1 hypothetical protein [Streptomyces actuosus]